MVNRVEWSESDGHRRLFGELVRTVTLGLPFTHSDIAGYASNMPVHKQDMLALLVVVSWIRILWHRPEPVHHAVVG